MDKLRISFIKAAQEIKLAIIQNRPIIVRHHNDTDGYCAGYALEKISEKDAFETIESIRNLMFPISDFQ